ncbi:LuxR C-terminal-related transcriptional regulator [Streptomyces sp. NPDC001165]|uniref:helix-turn-helix transcriptional regulator n=1 Tax=Streptomyces sp. NPDC001165 TaxID=3364546 RepID=UPI0036D06510
MAGGIAPHQHPEQEDVCADGAGIYERALRSGGSVARAEAERAPCLIDLGLLHPDPDREDIFLAVEAAVVLPRLLDTLERRVAVERERGARLAELLNPMMRLEVASVQGGPFTILEGLPRIKAAIDEAVDDAQERMLAIQPGGIRSESALADALPRALKLAERKVQMRTLYQPSARYGRGLVEYYTALDGMAEARILDELPERLLLFDLSVAIIPAQADRQVALEVRQPALIDYLAGVFDQLWFTATPLYAPPEPSVDGVTDRQRAIAQLLVDGHTDAIIAKRFGINERTVRNHIAKLSDAVGGSNSRLQLGWKLARSGLLDVSDADCRVPPMRARPARETGPGGTLSGSHPASQ